MTRAEYERIRRRLLEAAIQESTASIDLLSEMARRLREADIPSLDEVRQMHRRADAVHARLASARDQYDAATRELASRGFSPDASIGEGRP